MAFPKDEQFKLCRLMLQLGVFRIADLVDFSRLSHEFVDEFLTELLKQKLITPCRTKAGAYYRITKKQYRGMLDKASALAAGRV